MYIFLSNNITFYLFVLGLLITNLIKGFWFNLRSGAFVIHRILVSLVFLFVYIYIRSFINVAISFIIPISIFDFILILLTFLFLSYKKDKFRDIIKSIKQYKYSYLLFFLIFWIISLYISINELPRLGILSSDPATHASFVTDIFKNWTIFSKEYYINSSYPMGFHAITYIFLY